MNTDSTKSDLLTKLSKPKNRRAFANKYLVSHVAAQMRALRISRGLSQEKMSKETGIHQPRISAMEKPSYEKYTLSTLKQIAEIFDVVPFFEFISFAELLKRIRHETPQDLAPPTFAQSFVQREGAAPLPELPDRSEPAPVGLDQILKRRNDFPLKAEDNWESARKKPPLEELAGR